MISLVLYTIISLLATYGTSGYASDYCPPQLTQRDYDRGKIIVDGQLTLSRVAEDCIYYKALSSNHAREQLMTLDPLTRADLISVLIHRHPEDRESIEQLMGTTCQQAAQLLETSGDSQLLVNAGHIYRALGLADHSYRCFSASRQKQALISAAVEARTLYAQANSETDQELWRTRALDHAQAYLAQDPDHTQMHYLVGELAAQRMDYSLARPHLITALKSTDSYVSLEALTLLEDIDTFMPAYRNNCLMKLEQVLAKNRGQERIKDALDTYLESCTTGQSLSSEQIASDLCTRFANPQHLVTIINLLPDGNHEELRSTLIAEASHEKDALLRLLAIPTVSCDTFTSLLERYISQITESSSASIELMNPLITVYRGLKHDGAKKEVMAQALERATATIAPSIDSLSTLLNSTFYKVVRSTKKQDNQLQGVLLQLYRSALPAESRAEDIEHLLEDMTQLGLTTSQTATPEVHNEWSIRLAKQYQQKGDPRKALSLYEQHARGTHLPLYFEALLKHVEKGEERFEKEEQILADYIRYLENRQLQMNQDEACQLIKMILSQRTENGLFTPFSRYNNSYIVMLKRAMHILEQSGYAPLKDSEKKVMSQAYATLILYAIVDTGLPAEPRAQEYMLRLADYDHEALLALGDAAARRLACDDAQKIYELCITRLSDQSPKTDKEQRRHAYQLARTYLKTGLLKLKKITKSSSSEERTAAEHDAHAYIYQADQVLLKKLPETERVKTGLESICSADDLYVLTEYVQRAGTHAIKLGILTTLAYLGSVAPSYPITKEVAFSLCKQLAQDGDLHAACLLFEKQALSFSMIPNCFEKSATFYQKTGQTQEMHSNDRDRLTDTILSFRNELNNSEVSLLYLLFLQCKTPDDMAKLFQQSLDHKVGSSISMFRKHDICPDYDIKTILEHAQHIEGLIQGCLDNGLITSGSPLEKEAGILIAHMRGLTSLSLVNLGLMQRAPWDTIEKYFKETQKLLDAAIAESHDPSIIKLKAHLLRIFSDAFVLLNGPSTTYSVSETALREAITMILPISSTDAQAMDIMRSCQMNILLIEWDRTENVRLKKKKQDEIETLLKSHVPLTSYLYDVAQGFYLKAGMLSKAEQYAKLAEEKGSPIAATFFKTLFKK